MRVAIIGLEHLGVVTAACVSNHQDIKLWDSRTEMLEKMRAGEKTWLHYEPGLSQAFIEKLMAHNLASSIEEAVEHAEIVWITYDTPVDDADSANYLWVYDRIQEIFPHLVSGQILLISSQVCVGFTEMVETRLREQRPELQVNVYCSPENIRRGKGLETFSHQKRVLIGAPRDFQDYGGQHGDVEKLVNLFAPFSERREWLTSRAAEMSKHALNAFLAMTIVFTNEIGVLCELYNIKPQDIENSLRGEGRIGVGLPLRYGEPYAGKTLGRDVETLLSLTRSQNRYLPLLKTITISNDNHKIRHAGPPRPAEPIKQETQVAD